ncbi:4Fe-4S ferredoxin, iron-sulfur binding [Magnetospirillum sp. XM-1]|uniref:4Fe-4S binding protein n=1 Tax=Magnetospirillum sp. XM-1 TaxID=1663591 RepID=UPI00073DF340|nr:4Fe-4S binding protein [Magnetospirillum sp. XM-1]CUW40542.1 4Fe-4S ferredoxin, iron-sulfur binding [Magnetospirillum sp. XM-1]
MKVGGKRVMVCSCEATMPLDVKALAKALGTEPPDQVYFQLCRSQADAFRKAAAAGEDLLVCCGQEAPLFAELARLAEAPEPTCVDIRDRAGWSAEAARATPKIAALIKDAAEESEPTPSVTLTSEGSVLILGQGQEVLDAAKRLGADRAVTCVLLPGHEAELIPPMVRSLGLFRGKPLGASGHLGAFKVGVADLAGASPSARGALSFEIAVGSRDLAADIVLDLTNQPALLGPRDGWLRVDPRDKLALERALAEIGGLVGEFEKPRWIKVDSALCAHSRNGQVACTRCLDICPSGALSPLGDAASVDAHVCGGHGSCAAVCPTGAIRFDVPAGNGLFKRLGVLLETHRAAGGGSPVLLIHDEVGGEALAALSRFGDGLPADVMPVQVAAVAAQGADTLLAALAKGAGEVLLLADPARRDDLDGARAAISLANRVAEGLGWQARARLEVESDPSAIAALLPSKAPKAVDPAAEFLVLGGKRQTLGLALTHLHRHAPAPVDVLALETGDPFGTILVDEAKCTLCMACISACPAKALSGHPDKPSLGILEANCVQCGLCRVTCPEKAVTLVPRLAFGPEAKVRTVLKEEEPYQCIRCGKPFASKSVIERMTERMSGHAMFKGTGKLDLIKMCEDCRVVAQYELEEGARPMAGAAAPVTRTTEDYLKERDGKG